ncbi:MAG: hypothetical protein U5N27_21340 [Rhizobium sp.]|nr:hypothetical protein [Rhizobium sp.]
MSYDFDYPLFTSAIAFWNTDRLLLAINAITQHAYTAMKDLDVSTAVLCPEQKRRCHSWFLLAKLPL